MQTILTNAAEKKRARRTRNEQPNTFRHPFATYTQTYTFGACIFSDSFLWLLSIAGSHISVLFPSTSLLLVNQNICSSFIVVLLVHVMYCYAVICIHTVRNV